MSKTYKELKDAGKVVSATVVTDPNTGQEALQVIVKQYDPDTGDQLADAVRMFPKAAIQAESARLNKMKTEDCDEMLDEFPA